MVSVKIFCTLGIQISTEFVEKKSVLEFSNHEHINGLERTKTLEALNSATGGRRKQTYYYMAQFLTQPAAFKVTMPFFLFMKN